MTQTPPTRDEKQTGLTSREAYNLVSDTVTGVNFRLRDNLIQGAAILATIIVGAVVGALLADDWRGGLFAGALIGMIAGLFISGIVIMIVRGVRHARGKHN